MRLPENPNLLFRKAMKNGKGTSDALWGVKSKAEIFTASLQKKNQNISENSTENAVGPAS